MSVTVAVTVWSPSRVGARAMSRLAEFERELIVLVVGDAKQRQATGSFARRTCPHARIVEVRSRDLAEARNRALDFTDAEAIAYLDADVEVGPTWSSALREAWTEAEPSVACIGGPLHLAFDPRLPDWLAPSMLSEFAAFDLGGGSRIVDLVEHSFFAGNVSFRAAALRGMGGFVATGASAGAPDRYDSEHRTQHLLAKQGWDGRYERELTATRLVDGVALTRAGFLRQRARFGARRAHHGDSLRGGAAIPWAARAGIATAAEVARAPRSPGAMTRADAFAVALGAVVPNLARSDFALAPEPRNPPPRRARRARGERGAVILLYHRLGSAASGRALSVDVGNFREQIAVLSQRTCLTLADVARGVRDGNVPEGVCLTFDDGYRDNLEHALPIATTAGISPTVFAATGPIATGTHFYWDIVDELLIHNPPAGRDVLEIELAAERRSWRTSSAAQRREARDQLHAWIQPRSRADIQSAVAQLRSWGARQLHHGAADTGADGAWRPMTIDELRRYARDGGTVGGHTRWHPNLAHQPGTLQREEIEGCRDDLTDWLGHEVCGFSYPYGGRADFTDATRAIVREAGFDYAVTNCAGRVGRNADPFALPRFCAPDAGGEQFERWLDTLMA